MCMICCLFNTLCYKAEVFENIDLNNKKCMDPIGWDDKPLPHSPIALYRLLCHDWQSDIICQVNELFGLQRPVIFSVAFWPTVAFIVLIRELCPSSLWSVMSVTPFCQPRRLVHFAGKHVHRPTKFFYHGSCCLERTSTRPTLTAHQSPTVPIQAENSSVPTSLQHCMIPLRTVCWRVKLCKL